MRPRITFITIGVDDPERSLRFYRDGLGLTVGGIIGTEVEYGAVQSDDEMHSLLFDNTEALRTAGSYCGHEVDQNRGIENSTCSLISR
jgi:catechol 2,3-dioxygenase-like lactoylglutathione lyase family enzyme